MNLDELRTVQSKERQKDSLQHLRPSFYQEVGEYIANLEAERERLADAADDPFSSPEVIQLTDEIETAKDVVEAIYERRMGKLVKQASLAAAGMAANDEGLTAEEVDLFDDLVDRIQDNKARVLEVLDNGGDVPPVEDGANSTHESVDSGVDTSADQKRSPTDPAPSSQPPAAGDTREPESEPSADGVSVADAMGGDFSSAVGEGEPAEAPPTESNETPPPPPPDEPPVDDGPLEDATEGTTPEPSASDLSPENNVDGTAPKTDETPAGNGADIERTTVKITQDVGSILGIDDREYTLASDDIVTLPEQNATPLLEREAAERLE
ncbi:hypothetical protein OB919_09105 [Halobacteria archaeon AArc-curdl1]|uniref:GINS subunit domain-containing protein n=1 Tax=Natronosalvus hydrolyticus TaxID=2979988 RepID=A0AAP2Z8D3_9EURY|nr:hypothetical protein [Halobacteria archaeon AArc-curdl1]